MGLDNPIHIAFLLILLLLVFGAKRLPELGRSLGAGMRGFKESLSGEGVRASLPVPQQEPTGADSSGQVSLASPAGEPGMRPA
jgi:sec-independent protein translocase protein TatA